jgi:peroxiredoxin Q/BCP
MLRSLLAVVCTFVVSGVAFAQDADKPVELKVGDEAPKFEAVDDAGKLWKSEDHVGKKFLVVYFYPKDQTPGCTKQGQCYRDAAPELKELGIEVVGVSRDTVESHQAFKDNEKLNFTLLADPEGVVNKAFGVKQFNAGPLELSSRWTFLIDLEGNIAYKDEKVDPAQDVRNILKTVDKLSKKSK